jgi:hypothetical protein
VEGRATALKDLPDDTVIDGELVALGHDGRPVFNLLQNFRSADLSSIIEPGEHVALSQVSDRSARKCWDSSRAMGWRAR